VARTSFFSPINFDEVPAAAKGLEPVRSAASPPAGFDGFGGGCDGGGAGPPIRSPA